MTLPTAALLGAVGAARRAQGAASRARAHAEPERAATALQTALWSRSWREASRV